MRESPFDWDPENYDRARPSYPEALFDDLWAYLDERMGPFRMITRGTDLPLLSWSLEDDANFALFEFSDSLRRSGWQVPAYTLPANLEDLAICRIVVRHGLSRDLSDLLLADVAEVLDRFGIERIAARWDELFADVLDERTPRRHGRFRTFGPARTGRPATSRG